MKASQVGYGELTDKKVHLITETDLVNKEQWVYNSIWQSRQVAAIVMDIIKPDYVPRIHSMHWERPNATIDHTLPIYR